MESKKIFRFKFSDEFLPTLIEFSRIHQYDSTSDFKEAFSLFCENNKNAIINETIKLQKNGYDKDVIVKIYKSARYYFKTKDYNPQEKKKRRIYIKLNREFIDNVDNHVLSNIRKNKKPAELFEEFMTSKLCIIEDEKKRLNTYFTKEKDVMEKIKKTYKNRYFIHKKHYLVE